VKVRLEAIPYRLPLRRPLVTARGTIRDRVGFWIVVWDEDGRSGLGEVAPLPGLGTEPVEEAARRIALLKGAGRIPFDPRDLDERMTGAPATRAGVELALLDLEARRAGVRLAEIVASEVHSPVSCSALLREIDPMALVAEAGTAVAAGYGTLKVKIGGRPLREDLHRIEVIREQIGPAIRLRADANGAWDDETAIRALSELERFDLEYVEQPVARNLAAVRRRSPVRIAADESIDSLASARALIAGRAADVLILKPMAIGGLRTAGLIAREAAAEGIGVVVTSILETAVGVAGALHFAAGLPSTGSSNRPHPDRSPAARPPGWNPAHGLATLDLFVETPAIGLGMPERGMLELPDGPGLGISLKGVSR
jgi:L-Ala-D/L-Glu epimerase